MTRRTIPPWWANPIVFIPGVSALAVICSCVVIALAIVWPRG